MIELPDDSDGPDGLRLKALRARLHAATVSDDAGEELRAYASGENQTDELRRML